MKQLLRDCYSYYKNESLKSDCENMKCLAPTKCMQFNAVYNILHFLADSQFNVSLLVNENEMLKKMLQIERLSLIWQQN